MTPEEQIDAIAESVLEEAGQNMVEDIRQAIADPYPPASAPGQAPHWRSGNLQDLIAYQVDVQGPLATLTVTSAAVYSVYLEEGTERMAQRPFMQPALEQWTPYLIQRLSAAFAAP